MLFAFIARLSCHCRKGGNYYERLITAINLNGFQPQWDQETLRALRSRLPEVEQGGGTNAEHEHQKGVLLTMIKAWGAG